MRDLDDPANPYRDQYADWDRWLLSSAKNPTMDEMQAWREGTAPAGWTWLRPTVTEDGWLVPQLAELDAMIRQQTDIEAYKARPHCVLTFSSAGVADPAMLERLEAAKRALWASRLPPVPDWLAGSMAKRVILLPDGGAVTYGPLGSGVGEVPPAQWRYDAAGNPEVYYRYDSAGREVGRTIAGQPWLELFIPGFTENVLLGSSKQGLIPVILNGYTVLSLADGTPQYTLDLTGAPLAQPGTPPRPGGVVVELEGEFLAEIATGGAG